ncbi:MAG: HAD family phosphatase [Desulfobacterota bacterium]|nr:HAD family phosphatase [Thermodesulfobacteriota bacterium]MDW8002117.1 HAD family phosphatase [Deltaproteobacteria bacterium]
MIRLFVFDLGGVILPFEHTQIADKLYEKSLLRNTLTPKEIFNFLFAHEDGLVNSYEEGKMSSWDFFLLIKERFKLELSFEEFKEVWNPIFQENEEVKEIIHALKLKGFPLFLLSNTNELHFSYIKAKYPVVHLMDRWILSYEIGAKKPKRAIYEAIFENVSFSPHEILYVDDIPRYVKAASELGMKAVVFSDAGSLKDFIRQNGVHID